MLHGSLYITALMLLLFLEMPNATRLHRTLEAIVSILLPVNHHSIAPQGAAMIYLGLDTNSRSVPEATRVAGWLLFVMGCIYVVFVRLLSSFS